ncbi:PTB-containing, cubilin and LRP1-interacting protein [Takifugu rubripes]|uniref:Phosphotyrosine interaction domain containing 1 n=2 Tax=Takifugu TaxID=31032 RepID=A0A674MZL6_TAKRU|nr:PTB-containing, cubilin and LRP1-interacting protein [Takifugu rubripes]XP_056906571.1 PTB-containing, cubilin and LRP1-interacting protein [Takifugu flavidus]|eukprot:XP_003977054.1 PREDICTED: PTB-containing, cubilin and LRP1-interacting protein [Takifugu rubripes]
MWQPTSERLQHFQTMLKTKLNVLTLRKEQLPTVIFHEPEAIELCSTTPLIKSKSHAGYKVSYLGKLMISGTKFLSGCTEPAVVALVERRAQESQHGAASANSLLEIRPFQVRLQHFEEHGEDAVSMDTYQVARIAFCTADHSIKPNIFAWIYREINDDLSFQMDCHAVECENKLEAKKLAHSMMEAFHKTFHSMRSDGRIHKSDSADDVAENSSTPEDSTPDDG